MRGFSTSPTRQVTLTAGGESITYTLYPLPVLFMPMLRAAIPEGDLTGADRSMVYEQRAIAMVAESLRPTEDGIPPHPVPAAALDAWRLYVDELAQLFQAAGLTVAMLNRLCFAVDELEKVSGEVLETVGNGS